MLERLRNFDQQLLDRSNVDDLIELCTFGRLAVTTYDSFKLPTPGWITEGLETLDREINSRRRDILIARQREVQASLRSLRTREERRKELEDEAAKLTADLGISGPTSQQP